MGSDEAWAEKGVKFEVERMMIKKDHHDHYGKHLFLKITKFGQNLYQEWWCW